MSVVQSCTAAEALTRLKEGNARLVAGTAKFPTVQKEVPSVSWMKPVARFPLAALLFCAVAGFSGMAARAADTLPLPPHLGAGGQKDFAAYLDAGGHKAFAIAPGGAWAWVSGEASADYAQSAAIDRCADLTEQRCVVYAVDGRRVLDETRWSGLWRLPELTSAEKGRGNVGLRRGAVFPELSFASADGRPRRLSEWRGQVVVLHFWGSWCGPCRRELPDMAKEARALSGQRVAFIPLQVRESFAVAARWLKTEKITLPLYDSGMRGLDDGLFRIVGGGTLPDRSVAPVFPSTVVLDRNGRVVFTHQGPIEHWAEYVPFLLDLTR